MWYPWCCLAVVYAVVLGMILRFFGVGPQPKHLQLRSGWRPVSEMDRGRGKKR